MYVVVCIMCFVLHTVYYMYSILCIVCSICYIWNIVCCVLYTIYYILYLVSYILCLVANLCLGWNLCLLFGKTPCHVAWERCFVIICWRMIELFFEVGPGKPTIHVPIQVFIFHAPILKAISSPNPPGPGGPGLGTGARGTLAWAPILTN